MFRLPVLNLPFPLTYHASGDIIAAESDRWFAAGYPNFTEDKRCRLAGLKAGQLAAYCYNQTTDARLRVASDFMNFVFHLDDLTDYSDSLNAILLSDIVLNAFDFPHFYRRELPNGRLLPELEPYPSILARDMRRRCINDAKPGIQARFREDIRNLFLSMEGEVRSHETGAIFDIAPYVSDRRANSGCFPGFDLLEYTLGIDLPDAVVNNPTFISLRDSANDIIALSNDIYSYNVEQIRGDTYNILAIMMKTCRLDLQNAADRVAHMCKTALDNYYKIKAELPSWADIDRDATCYIQGLEDWIAGTYHWTFMTERYFGTADEDVRQTGVVYLTRAGTERKELLPKWV